MTEEVEGQCELSVKSRESLAPSGETSNPCWRAGNLLGGGQNVPLVIELGVLFSFSVLVQEMISVTLVVAKHFTPRTPGVCAAGKGCAGRQW